MCGTARPVEQAAVGGEGVAPQQLVDQPPRVAAVRRHALVRDEVEHGGGNHVRHGGQVPHRAAVLAALGVVVAPFLTVFLTFFLTIFATFANTNPDPDPSKLAPTKNLIK